MSFTSRGPFVPRVTQLDIDLIKEGKLSDDKVKDLLVRLMLKFNQLSNAVNSCQRGEHNLEDSPSGASWPPLQTGTTFAPRYEHWQTYFAGPLLNALPTSIAHGITTSASMEIYVAEAYAIDTTNRIYIPLPFVDVSGTVAASHIEIYADGTNIVITPTGDATNFNIVVVTLRWVD